MADIKPKLRVDVNHNPTKKGVKVQFVLPQTLEGDKKAEATQKLQSKLNQGLEQYNLTVSQDTDVPYSNVIGFLIPIADIKLLIKNAIGGGAAPEAPAEEPAPEEPMKEKKEPHDPDSDESDIFPKGSSDWKTRMQELAGIVTEATIKDLIDPLVKKLESMGYETDIDPTGGYKTLFAWKVMPDKSSLTVFVGPSDDELAKRDYKGFDNFETIDVSFNYYTTKVTKKFFGLFKSKERVGQHLSDETKEGQNIDLGRGMFDIPIEDSVNRVADLVKKAEQKVAGQSQI